MADTQQELQACADCGATIYPEHLQKHAARRWEGRLLCPHCLREQKGVAGQTDNDAGAIDLVDADDAAQEPPRPTQIRYSDGSSAADQDAERTYQRTLHHQGVFATRCKTFHCKLTDASIVHLNDQINEWVDEHEDIEIKFANTTTGVVEGKSSDPHLIVTVFY